jgi:hypothetical protein
VGQFKHVFKWANSLALIAAFASALGIFAVLYTFILGRHYIIPTAILADVVILANLAFFGIQGRKWAQYFLFWLLALLCAHTFFALFWARTPPEVLGSAFLPLYLSVCLLSGVLAWQYAGSNQLFQHSHPGPHD